MQKILECVAAQHAELNGLLDGLDDAGWATPTRCPGWTVCDVVLHLAQTDEMVTASAQGRLADAGAIVRPDDPDPRRRTADAVAEAVLVAERGKPPAEVLARWRGSAAEVIAALGAHQAGDRLIWLLGDVAARTLATTRLAEAWIHTLDVADALGVEVAPTDRIWHIARLAWRTLPYAFARDGRRLAGPVAVELTGPGGESWSFAEGEPVTTVRGDAVAFCLVAARRLDPAQAGLATDGPDGAAVLDLVRTYA